MVSKTGFNFHKINEKTRFRFLKSFTQQMDSFQNQVRTETGFDITNTLYIIICLSNVGRFSSITHTGELFTHIGSYGSLYYKRDICLVNTSSGYNNHSLLQLRFPPKKREP